MPGSIQAGDVLAGRYRLEDLLIEKEGGRSWRAHDAVLHRPVSVHVIGCDDSRADRVLAAARRMGPLDDRRVLRVLDADKTESVCYVVSEWGQGESLDNLLLREGPLPPRRAAWIVGEVADSLARAHDAGLTHGRLVPENILIDHHGHVRIIGFGVEAALHGAPPAPVSTDVTDLAALLHATLTGKWAGRSDSQLPPAPREQDRVLRPRRVRAGIPRQLDAVCDDVLNPGAATRPAAARSQRSETDLSSARGIAEALTEFVGDPTDLQESAPPPHVWTRSASQTARTAPNLSPVVGRATGSDTGPPPAATAPTAEPESPVHAPPPVSADLATEAGMPVFHEDTEDVEWLRARAEAPPPPPPLEPAQPKPLFAPDPPEGQPVRRPRAGAVAATTGDYWPWDSGSTGSGSGSTDSGSTGSGSSGSGGWRFDSDDTGHGTTDTGERVPGRSWIRLAMLIAFATAVLIAAVAAYQLGLGSPPATTPDPDGGSTTQPAPPTPFTDLTATDFDPQGSEPREEYPELVPLAVDGDASTSWRTSTYRQNFGPGGLKSGVGVILDLGGTRPVREVAVTVEGGETSVAVYVTDGSPSGVADLTPAGDAAGAGELVITLDEAPSGQFVTVWLTSLPRVSDGFRGTIAEIEIRG